MNERIVIDLADMVTRPAVGHPGFTNVEFMPADSTIAPVVPNEAELDGSTQGTLFTVEDFLSRTVLGVRDVPADLTSRPSPMSGHLDGIAH